jgi:hypothetical protein
MHAVRQFQTGCDMREEIKAALAVLVGLPFCDWGRAADMAMLGFGEMHTVNSPRHGLSEVPDYSIHLQCHWRILGSHGIVVGSSDIFRPPDGYPDVDFEYDLSGANRYDKLMGEFMALHRDHPLIVEPIVADRVGGMRMSLTGDHALELFSNTAPCDDDEHWRLLRREVDSRHFVVTSHGVRG